MPDIVRMSIKHRSEVVLVLTLSAIQRVSGLCMLVEGATACLAHLACPNVHACICVAELVTWCGLAMQLTAEQAYLT